MLTCAQSRRVVDAPVKVEPAAAPAPPAAAPTEATDTQGANRDAVDGAPEEDVSSVAIFIFLPFLGNEVRVLEQEIQNIGVQDRFAREFLAKFVPLDSAFFLRGGEIELHL